jgi:hypothetical protein
MQLRSFAWTHRHTVTQVESNVSRAARCSYAQLLGHMDTWSHRLNIMCHSRAIKLRSVALTHGHTVTQVQCNVSIAAQFSYVQLLGHMDTWSHRLNFMCQEQRDAVTFSCLDTWSHRLNLMCQEIHNAVTFICLDTWTHGHTG